MKRNRNNRGQTLVEYALLLAFICVVAIGVLNQLGIVTKATFGATTTPLEEAQLGKAMKTPPQ